MAITTTYINISFPQNYSSPHQISSPRSSSSSSYASKDLRIHCVRSSSLSMTPLFVPFALKRRVFLYRPSFVFTVTRFLCMFGGTAGMDSGGSPTLFPLQRCKTIHLVRHAQGIHNVEGDKNYKAYMSQEYFDAHLTQLGWEQVDNLRKHVHSTGLIKKIDVVITSPLLRTIQTAVGVFGGEVYTDGVDILPLMVADAGNSGRAAISSLDSPPILAVEQCREHLGVHPCDKRRSISEYQRLFPAIDFSLIESDDDTLWKADVRETKAEVATRGMKFLNWLFTRKEKEIAIVTHSGFLFHTLAAIGNECHPLVRNEISSHFANCELRSMVIVDTSKAGSDSSSTNYPGKIPSGLDLPSDIAEQKQEKDEPTSLNH